MEAATGLPVPLPPHPDTRLGLVCPLEPSGGAEQPAHSGPSPPPPPGRLLWPPRPGPLKAPAGPMLSTQAFTAWCPCSWLLVLAISGLEGEPSGQDSALGLGMAPRECSGMSGGGGGGAQHVGGPLWDGLAGSVGPREDQGCPDPHPNWL